MKDSSVCPAGDEVGRHAIAFGDQLHSVDFQVVKRVAEVHRPLLELRVGDEVGDGGVFAASEGFLESIAR